MAVGTSGGSTRGAPTTARRLRAPSWKDPRLAVGVLLVVGAVVLGARVVAAADDSVPVYAAAGPLVAGEPVTAGDLQVVRLRLEGGDGAGAYVSADRPPAEGVVVLRAVGAGELVPATALGSADDVDVRPVGVPVDAALPSGVAPGALVDVWVSAPDPEVPGALLPPELTVRAAPVAEVDDAEGALGATAATTVQVLVGPEELPDVLAALAADARIALVPSPGGTAPGTGGTRAADPAAGADG